MTGLHVGRFPKGHARRSMAALGRRPHRARCVCGELFEGHGNSKYCSEKCRAPVVRRRRQLSKRRNA